MSYPLTYEAAQRSELADPKPSSTALIKKISAEILSNVFERIVFNLKVNPHFNYEEPVMYLTSASTYAGLRQEFENEERDSDNWEQDPKRGPLEDELDFSKKHYKDALDFIIKVNSQTVVSHKERALLSGIYASFPHLENPFHRLAESSSISTVSDAQLSTEIEHLITLCREETPENRTGMDQYLGYFMEDYENLVSPSAIQTQIYERAEAFGREQEDDFSLTYSDSEVGLSDNEVDETDEAETSGEPLSSYSSVTLHTPPEASREFTPSPIKESSAEQLLKNPLDSRPAPLSWVMAGRNAVLFGIPENSLYSPIVEPAL